MILRNISEAKAQLSRLIALVEKGEEILILRAGKPAAKLTAYSGLKRKRRPGALNGKIKYKGNFEFSKKELSNLFDID